MISVGCAHRKPVLGRGTSGVARQFGETLELAGRHPSLAGATLWGSDMP